jgi:hypothetical protein
MIATWEVGMQMLTASKQATDFQSLTEQGALAVKLMSVFERQFVALTKARKPPQVVTVEHVHKHLHFEAPGATGDEIRIEGQAHATDPRTLAIAPSTPLLGQDTARDALPVAGNEARPAVECTAAHQGPAHQRVSATDLGNTVVTAKTISSCAEPCGRCYVRPARRWRRGHKRQPQQGKLGLQGWGVRAELIPRSAK